MVCSSNKRGKKEEEAFASVGLMCVVSNVVETVLPRSLLLIDWDHL